MSVLKKTTMKEQVYELIKERILNQTYTLGEKINMFELAQELGVSNSPIREALSLLEKEGLVTFVANAGPSVIRIDKKIAMEVEQTAKILLVGGYAQCVEQGKIPQVIEEMERYLSLQRELVDVTTKESCYEFAQNAIAFDMCLIRVFNNTMIESTYAAFFNLLFLVVLYDHQHFDVHRLGNIEEHEKILDAIKAGDHERVKKDIYEHFDREVWSD